MLSDTAPFLISAEVQLGGYLHTGAWLRFDPQVFREAKISGFVVYAFTGAPLVGLALALVGTALTFAGVHVKRRWWPPKTRPSYQLPTHAPPWWHATERLAARYAPTGPSTPAQRSRFHYVRVKSLMDPVSQMLTSLVSGHLMDIGSGRGQVPLILLELGVIDSANGVDWDDSKVAAAIEAAAREPALPASFRVGDMRDAELESADTVLLIDVLHYLSLQEQDELLDRAAASVRPGGRIIIRDADTERGWRSWITLAEEIVFTALRFNRGPRVRFRAARETVARLERAGLTCRVEPAWGNTPFANVLIVATRPAAD